MSEPPSPGSSLAEAIASQRRALNRMKATASAVLVLMLGLFVVSSLLQGRWPLMAYLRAFAEAAMVGGCADWFAVVALFRRPLGLPIPHTAVIPRQKDRLALAVGRFVAQHLLTPEDVASRLEGVDFSAWVSAWLAEDANLDRLAQGAQDILTPLLERLNRGWLSDSAQSLIDSGVRALPASPLMANLLSALVAEGALEPAMVAAAGAAQRYLEHHQAGVRDRVVKATSAWIRGWIDGRVADAVMAEVLADLAAAQVERRHPWRLEIRSAVDRLIVRLKEDPAWIDRGEAIKQRLLDHEATAAALAWLRSRLQALVSDGAGEAGEAARRALRPALSAIAPWLRDDQAAQAFINRRARTFIQGVVASGREEAGRFAADVLRRWDAATLVDRLELQVGGELQYIRLNGTVVGGLVGLIIFTAARLWG